MKYEILWISEPIHEVTFCNKELALERIKILALKNASSVTLEDEIVEQLKIFDINEARCFDPNEGRKVVRNYPRTKIIRWVNRLVQYLFLFEWKKGQAKEILF